MAELHQVIVGQDEVLEQLVYAVFCAPLPARRCPAAKTVMVQTWGLP